MATGNKIINSIICGCLIPVLVHAQLPDFIQRLDAGDAASSGFHAKVSIELYNNRILVNSTINRHDFKFLIDTHSPVLLYDYVVDELHLDTLDKSAQLGASFLTGFLTPVFPLIDTFSIAGVEFSGIGAMSMKKTASNPLKNIPIDGILGSNLMKHAIWQFNFVDSTMVLSDDQSECDYIVDAIRIPFVPRPVQGSPDILLVVDGDSITAEFDTGNNGFINALSPMIAKKISAGQAIKWSTQLDIPISRDDRDTIETHYYVLLDSIQIGNQSFYNIPIIAYNPKYQQTMGKGSIGVDFMKHFITTIDWQVNKIYLFPTDDLNPIPHHKRTFGFTYGYRKDTFIVRSIFSGSPAERMGIQIGDEITMINGIRLSQLSKRELSRYLSGRLVFSSDTDENIEIAIIKDGVENRYVFTAYTLFKD
ncbi:MAG: PDZ domain-containing protein [FCB group bacterium]|nr:PDZ domain-containing protein [FCB group bacterium]